MIIFDGKLLSPAPLLTISRQKEEEKGGRVTARKCTIQMQGTLISHMGSPRSDGSFWTLAGEPPEESIAADSRHTAILTKQAALRTLLEQQNSILEVHPWDGNAPTKFTVRLRNIEFPADIWHGLCKWTATFDADEQGVTNPGVESLNETWQMETLDENLRTYRVTHNISVKGRDQRNADGSIATYAWQHARNYALNTIGLGLDAQKMESSGVLSISASGYNYLRTESLDEVEGTVQLGESWIAFDPNNGPAATHEQTISKRGSAEGVYSVVVEGAIQGLRTTDNASYQTLVSKATNRDAKWALVQPTLYSSATGWYGGTLHTSPLSFNVQANQTQGTMSYSVEYSNRTTTLAAGAIVENVEIRDTSAPDIYAGIVIPGRANGTLLQDIDTSGPRRRSLSIEIQLGARTSTNTPVAPDTDAYVLTRIPSANSVFLENDEAVFNETNGRYSRNTVWIYSN